MELTGWKIIMTDYGKYGMYLKFLTGHFQNFTTLQKIWQLTICVVQRKGDFSDNIFPRNKHLASKFTNFTIQLVTHMTLSTWGRTAFDSHSCQSDRT